MHCPISNLQSPISLLFITLLAFALRLILLDSYPLREDEAIYGYWALHFWHQDPWFLTVWPDKPPLFLWLLAGVFSLFGENAAGGRFLNIALSTLTVPVVAAIARHLWGKRAGLVAGLAIAFNPFAISFASTLYTDTLLILTGSLALYLALTRRWFWAGLWLAAAIMTKQQGVLYAPLVLAVLWRGGDVGRRGEEVKGIQGDRESMITDHGSRITNHLPRTTHHALRTLFGFLLVAAPILLWDSQRWAVAPSPWDWSVRNYALLRFAPISEWFPRAQQWGTQLWYLTASGWMWAVVGVGIWGMGGWREGEKGKSRITDHGSRTTHLVILWSLSFIAVHIITTLQIWDRYLLPLAPIVALAVANCELRVARIRTYGLNLQSLISNLLLPLLLLTLLTPPAWSAAHGQLPLGGDHGDYVGLDAAIKWVEEESAESTNHASRITDHGSDNSQFILYHRALGWHYRFYLYQPVTAGRVDLRWFPSSVYLADNASKAPHRRKFLIEPHWSSTPDLAFHLRSRGLHLIIQRVIGNFTIYEIIQLPQSRCDWCFCGAHTPFPELDVMK